MPLTDSHCHLELIAESGEGELEGALEAATEAGVDRIINIGLGPDNHAVLARARQYPNVFATLGWHPHEKVPPQDDDLMSMLELASDPRVVAIGEVGLDYYWRPGYHEVTPDIQKESFRRMLQLARKASLPVMVHNRDAHDDTLAMLENFEDVQVVMHAFSGDAEFARECIARGIVMSIAGPVTYPSAAAVREAVEAAPVDQLIVETDAPFLPPQPWRGKPNRPHMMVETAGAVAQIKGLSLEDFATVSTRTADRVFRFPTATAFPPG
ncbi:MAG: TatD DNase family protein [Chloroflexota bacterium]|jgi:TatD DNase family protein|nr:TatD DNase family protein [Chloroflexota bacterium]